MSVRYRFKRNSALVNEPIPAHPDAMYRPQNRPLGEKISPVASSAVGERSVGNNAVVAAPLMAANGGFSPWWIIGPLFAVLAVLALAALMYINKKKKTTDSDLPAEVNDHSEKRTVDRQKTTETREKSPNRALKTNALPGENIPLKNIHSNIISEEQKRMSPLVSSTKGSSPLANLIPSTPVASMTSTPSSASKLGQSSVEGHQTSAILKSDINKDKKAQQISSTSDSTKILPGKSNIPSRPESFPGAQRNKDFPGKEVSNLNDRTSPGHSPLANDLNSPEQHGIGKSPLISSIPTGSKRNEKENLSSTSAPAKVLDPNQPNDSSSSSTSNQISKPIKTISENPFSPTDRLHPQVDTSSERKNGKSAESGTSLGRATSGHSSKSNTLLPHVPQCKTNTSSEDDDDYDDFYPLPANSSTMQPSASKRLKTGKSNSNVNAYVVRKKRTSLAHRSITKSVHLKDKKLHRIDHDHP